tara:strand:- start:101 stop:301 length:201 start_codon:yes stop_codon:yes gene_type:complete
MQNFYEDIMNEILLEIEELEYTVNSLKNIDKPEAIIAIRSLDEIIDRKKLQVTKFEKEIEQEFANG